MSKSKISWTEKTWNPITGCTKISAGCKNCYAEKMAKRLQAMGQEKYKNGFNLTIHPKDLEAPLHWKKPSMIFVNSMSDLFHEKIFDGENESFLDEIFAVMAATPHHTYQVLTKRSGFMRYYMNDNRRAVYIEHALETIYGDRGWCAPEFDWPLPNVWIGVSVEDHAQLSRIDDLRISVAKVKFVSFEPMLSWINSADLEDIDWAIVGGESGPYCRPFDPDWARGILQECRRSGTAFYMKQLGGSHCKFDRLEDFPEDLRIREYPNVRP